MNTVNSGKTAINSSNRTDGQPDGGLTADGYRWFPVGIDPEPGPAYVGLQPGGSGTPVSPLSQNFAHWPDVFDERDQLRLAHPACEVFADANG